eukprot:NODE_3237_length_1004_cov_32.533637_g3091_i0.p1 GENE.NODE_3237_length_1004_cov_32.533637_g3091_i0~~NODE_3237_length_1004_cov_32.533637_g3091_i0.p1  ORF type:complete len:283 (-),score=100.43 NODE_3237_length_1004_cov_32.533637_g3091_i0:91-939(-)
MTEPANSELIDSNASEDAIREKYMQEIQLYRKMEGQLVQVKRKMENATKEKDAAVQNLSRSISIRSKLENVCRQLQKQNKAIQEESIARANEDTAQRNELSTKFHLTIEDITKRMQEHDNDKDMLLKEREVLKDRIGNLEEQLVLRDQHYAQQLNTKDLQAQLASTRQKQQNEIFQQDETRRQRYRERIEEQVTAEHQLTEQLQLYAEKFGQFQQTLTNSNNVFNNFKSDLIKMTDREKELVRENGIYINKAQLADTTLRELMESHPKHTKQLQQLETQVKN